MVITFTSEIKIQGQEEKQKIEFLAPVSITHRDEWTAYEFVEPAHGEHNIIEVTEDAVNIIAGRNTLNLSLAEKYFNEYILDGVGTWMLETHMQTLDIKKDLITFEYTLTNTEKVKIGDYKITLKISE